MDSVGIPPLTMNVCPFIPCQGSFEEVHGEAQPLRTDEQFWVSYSLVKSGHVLESGGSAEVISDRAFSSDGGSPNNVRRGAGRAAREILSVVVVFPLAAVRLPGFDTGSLESAVKAKVSQPRAFFRDEWGKKVVELRREKA